MTATVALIQARMSSTRFPGKVLEPIAGRPSIVYMAERVRRAKTLDLVAVVTSVDPTDDQLASALRTHGIPLFRGALGDVLDRYVSAAGAYGAKEIVRLTGDCPLADPAVIDEVVTARRRAGADYASNIEPRTFPDGLDVECFTREALDRADREARMASEREHVTPWMRRDDTGLRRIGVRREHDDSSLRLTVDFPEDLAAIRRLVDAVGGEPDAFGLADMLRCLEAHPEIAAMNAARGTAA